MIYAPLIQNAISFALKVHDRQQRKGKALPYITHPLAVGLIVSRVTNDEDVIAAAVLHDTIEDCIPRGSVTKKVLADQFGERVARIVDDVSEKEKSLAWEKRKWQALQHIKSMDHDSLLVKGSDVLH